MNNKECPSSPVPSLTLPNMIITEQQDLLELSTEQLEFMLQECNITIHDLKMNIFKEYDKLKASLAQIKLWKTKLQQLKQQRETYKHFLSIDKCDTLMSLPSEVTQTSNEETETRLSEEETKLAHLINSFDNMLNIHMPHNNNNNNQILPPPPPPPPPNRIIHSVDKDLSASVISRSTNIAPTKSNIALLANPNQSLTPRRTQNTEDRVTLTTTATTATTTTTTTTPPPSRLPIPIKKQTSNHDITTTRPGILKKSK